MGLSMNELQGAHIAVFSLTLSTSILVSTNAGEDKKLPQGGGVALYYSVAYL